MEGIVQKFWNYANFQFMVFSSDYGSYNRQGEVKTAKDAPLPTVVAAINNELPDGGTFTGESLYEAEDYYGQHNNHSYENNNAYIGITNALKDPYYDAAPGGDIPIYCRKTYILLISDGAWNGSVDPIRPARNMRINDMRMEAGMDGRQNVTTYAIYAFGQSDPTGRNAMIATAMFGGFDFTSTDLWPYPYTDWPATNSLGMAFPILNVILPVHGIISVVNGTRALPRIQVCRIIFSRLKMETNSWLPSKQRFMKCFAVHHREAVWL